jgi:hypothetical protein
MKVAIEYRVHELFEIGRNVMPNIPKSYFNGQHTRGCKQYEILKGSMNTKVWCSTCRIETTKSHHIVIIPAHPRLPLLQNAPDVSEMSSVFSSNDQGAPLS